MDKTSSVIFTIQCITHHLRFVHLLHIVTYYNVNDVFQLIVSWRTERILMLTEVEWGCS
jgi:hypothetical protein